MTKRTPPCGNYGDIDGDGYVTQADADILAEHVAGLIILSPGQLSRADVYGDGDITARNVSLIAKYAAGVAGYDTFPVCAMPLEHEPEPEPPKTTSWIWVAVVIIILYLLTRG